jgi:PilZ domain
VAARRHDRYSWLRKARWDFFTAATGPKHGYVANISKGGCLLKTTELIEHRRWIRILIQDGDLAHTAVGRIIRCEHAIEAIGDGDISLYRYGIEFVQPCFASTQDLDLILALSSKNLTVRSCLSLNTKSS